MTQPQPEYQEALNKLARSGSPEEIAAVLRAQGVVGAQLHAPGVIGFIFDNDWPIDRAFALLLRAGDVSEVTMVEFVRRFD
jgi:hypothetical protein